jgi:hypothetical protein
VFLISRWSIYNRGWITKGITKGYRHQNSHFLSDDLLTTSTPEGSQQVFARAVPRTVAALRARGIRVVLVKSVPILRATPPELFWHESRGRRVATTLGEHLEWQRHSATQFEGLADGNSVLTLDPSSALCSDERCRYRDDDGFYYRDESHLTRYGARLVYAELKQQLKGMLSELQ